MSVLQIVLVPVIHCQISTNFLGISLKFDESKAPIEKLDHIKFWSHSSIFLILAGVFFCC